VIQLFELLGVVWDVRRVPASHLVSQGRALEAP